MVAVVGGAGAGGAGADCAFACFFLWVDVVVVVVVGNQRARCIGFYLTHSLGQSPRSRWIYRGI